MKKSDVGKLGEDLAAEFLAKRGYSILRRNFRNARWSEVDIVAKDCGQIVFVEVKTRTSRSFGYPEEAVGYYKLRALLRSVGRYLLSHGGAVYRVEMVSALLDMKTRRALIKLLPVEI